MFCLLLVFSAGLIGAMSGIMLSKWMFFSIFLIFLGGMMVMFLYICALSMNEKMIIKKIPFIFLAFIFFLLNSENSNFSNSLFELYNSCWSASIILFIIYLFMTLLICVKLVQNFKGAIMKMW